MHYVWAPIVISPLTTVLYSGRLVQTSDRGGGRVLQRPRPSRGRGRHCKPEETPGETFSRIKWIYHGANFTASWEAYGAVGISDLECVGFSQKLIKLLLGFSQLSFELCFKLRGNPTHTLTFYLSRNRIGCWENFHKISATHETARQMANFHFHHSKISSLTLSNIFWTVAYFVEWRIKNLF